MSEKLQAALVNAIVPGVVTAVGALALAYYQAKSQAHDQQIADQQHTQEMQLESARAAASASAQSREIEQSIRDQNKRDEIALLRDLAPRVAGSAASANCPWVVGLWQSAYPNSPAPVLSTACPSLPPPPAEHWMVSAGTYVTQAEACSIAAEAGAKGLPAPRVFERPIGDKVEYVTTVGDYAAKTDAEPIAAAARTRVRFYSTVVLNPGWRLHDCPAKPETAARDAG